MEAQIELPELPEELVGYFNADRATRERMDELIREYARAAALKERERCALVCESEEVDYGSSNAPEERAYNMAIEHCAAAIRKG